VTASPVEIVDGAEGELPPRSAFRDRPALAKLGLVLRPLAVALVVAAVAYAVERDWTAVSRTVSRLSPLTVAASLLGALVGLLATVKSWQHLLHGLGSPLRTVPASQVFLTGQLARYLPGSVWAFLLQAQLGRRHAIPRTRSLIGVLLAVGVTTVSGLSLAVVTIPALESQWGSWVWLLAAGPLGLVCLLPRVLTALANLALRVLRRPPLVQPLPGRAVLAALLWSLVSWGAYGGQLWILGRDSSGLGVGSLPLATGAFALAVCAGFVAFVLPSGVGVREAVITVSLTSVMAPGTALAIALVSRLVCTAADVIGALVAGLVGHLAERRAGRRP
jgi:uncharacterized membrane protein YbhN (UPF0104 family)